MVIKDLQAFLSFCSISLGLSTVSLFWAARWFLCQMQAQAHPVKDKRTTLFHMCPFSRQQILSLMFPIGHPAQSPACALNAREAGKVSIWHFHLLSRRLDHKEVMAGKEPKGGLTCLAKNFAFFPADYLGETGSEE